MAKKEIAGEEKFAIPFKNIYLIIGGLLIMILGFVLMTGGGTDDPNVFDGEKMFSFTRIVLAPVVILIGFAAEIFAIMYKPKQK